MRCQSKKEKKEAERSERTYRRVILPSRSPSRTRCANSRPPMTGICVGAASQYRTRKRQWETHLDIAKHDRKRVVLLRVSLRRFLVLGQLVERFFAIVRDRDLEAGVLELAEKDLLVDEVVLRRRRIVRLAGEGDAGEGSIPRRPGPSSDPSRLVRTPDWRSSSPSCSPWSSPSTAIRAAASSSRETGSSSSTRLRWSKGACDEQSGPLTWL